MIPAVPLIVRLALSAACIAVSKAAMATAGWITPELNSTDRQRRRQEQPVTPPNGTEGDSDRLTIEPGRNGPGGHLAHAGSDRKARCPQLANEPKP